MFDREHGEHPIAVHRIKIAPVEHAVNENGFFGNQNTVARLKDKKWNYTVTRLMEIFGFA
jgi:hypothetical protein